MHRFFLSAFCVSFSLLSFMPEGQAQEQEQKANPVIAAYEAFSKELDGTSQRHFGVVYGNYNLIQVVKTVRNSVGKAITSCGEKNPEMKAPLSTRFETWNAMVSPILEEAILNINNMILAQDYAKPKKIKSFFKLLDDERAKSEEETEKVPVTTPEACQYLLEQMDNTQDNMTQLLQTTLISLPRVMQAEDQAAEAEKIEDEEAPETE